GRLALECIEAMLIDVHPIDDRDVDVHELGRIDGLQQRHDEIQRALTLSPARATAALQRIRNDCLRLGDSLEREAAADREPGTPYDWGVRQADFDILRGWPAPSLLEPDDTPAAAASSRIAIKGLCAPGSVSLDPREGGRRDVLESSRRED